MDISQLRTLIYVAELGSLSKAADRLRIAQPALSRQIRLLEQELGTRLFDRHGRGMIATEKGHDVLRHAQRIMAEMEEIRVLAQDENAPLRGHVSIGMPPTASDILSEPLVSTFQETHPDATLRIVNAYSGYLVDWLHRGDIDAAILYNPKNARSFHIQPLLEEALFLIGPANFDKERGRQITFSELEEERLLLPSIGNGLRSLLEKYAQEAGITLNVKFEADSYSTLKSIVQNNHGVTVLPLAPIREELNAGKLCAVPIVDPVPVRRLIISYPTHRPVSRLARFSGQVIASTVKKLVEEGVCSGRVLTEI
ncbi:LysR family transcriptional regulator [Brucella sp. 458]|uniref:LysR family transcriptional regulator n=1 Tax=Brucella sp. 458 TaxID=2821140 RepID=UPI001ADF9BD8|nr:LysR family transcriptional regulator [Brucella sp. 458]